MKKRINIIFTCLLLLAAFNNFLYGQNRKDFNSDEIKTASAFRLMINDAITGINPNYSHVKEMLQNYINDYFTKQDSTLTRRLINRINKDSNAVKECRYIYNILKNWAHTDSKYFRFYYPGDSLPPGSQTAFWDKEYERLSDLFMTNLPYITTFIADPKENFGRCFPPWEIFTGIRQKEIDLNPHELVHLFLFRYSDVPFFHEPLAFMYGTDRGDSLKIRDRFLRMSKKIMHGKFISSAELLHFPQIIGLDEVKWASAFCFVYKLERAYGIKKLLLLMNQNLWTDSIEDYLKSFKKIYGIELKVFEKELCGIQVTDKP